MAAHAYGKMFTNHSFSFLLIQNHAAGILAYGILRLRGAQSMAGWQVSFFVTHDLLSTHQISIVVVFD